MCYNYTDLTLVHIQIWPSVGLRYMEVGVSISFVLLKDIFWEDSVSSCANSSSVLYPPSTFCLWVALHVTGIPPDDAHCTLPSPQPSWPVPSAVYGGSVIQALIIPAGHELPLPCSLHHRGWPRTEAERVSRAAHPRLCQISFSSFLLKLKDNKQGEVILIQLAIWGLT